MITLKDIPYSSEEDMTVFLRIFRRDLKAHYDIEFEDFAEYKEVKDTCADCMTRTQGISGNKET